MSSAILYLAIVAIWAGVLIPRWLRRDTSASAAHVGADADTAPADQAPQADDATRVRPPDPVRPRPARTPAPAPDREHKRVLSARRRLLGMLMVLASGSAALAVMRMAAWWVVMPPLVMLFGYLALLREAAKADAGRRQAAHELARVRARPAPARRPAAPVAPPPRPATAPGAEIIDLPAREDPYDQFADAKLRAVGDLSRSYLQDLDPDPVSGELFAQGLRWLFAGLRATGSGRDDAGGAAGGGA